jgi:hypothetical protein
VRSLLRTGNRYLVIIRRGGAVGVGAGGEIVNVTQVFEPWGPLQILILHETAQEINSASPIARNTRTAAG